MVPMGPLQHELFCDSVHHKCSMAELDKLPPCQLVCGHHAKTLFHTNMKAELC